MKKVLNEIKSAALCSLISTDNDDKILIFFLKISEMCT